MEMFQRSFTEDDDMDEAALLEAANDWDDNLPGNSSAQYQDTIASPSKKSIKDYFSR